MTLADIQASVSALLDDKNNTYFTLTDLNYLINDAQRELQKELLMAGENYYTKVVTTTTVLGQQDLVLPSDFYKLHRVETVDNMDTNSEQVFAISYITINQKDFVAATGYQARPENYFLKRTHISLFPIPDKAYNFRMWYSYEIADLVNPTDVPDAPVDFHRYIVILAAIDGRLRDGRDTTDLVAKRTYYQDMLKKAAQNRNLDKPRSVRITTDEGFGTFL